MSTFDLLPSPDLTQICQVQTGTVCVLVPELAGLHPLYTGGANEHLLVW